MKELVFICSPLRGDVERNQEKCREYCRKACELSVIPYAPHLFFTQFLNDCLDNERNLGIMNGLEMLKRCDEIWVFADKDEDITEGMRKEIQLAKEIKLPIVYFDTNFNERD